MPLLSSPSAPSCLPSTGAPGHTRCPTTRSLAQSVVGSKLSPRVAPDFYGKAVLQKRGLFTMGNSDASGHINYNPPPPPLLDVLCQTQWSGIFQPPSRLPMLWAVSFKMSTEACRMQTNSSDSGQSPGAVLEPTQPVLTTGPPALLVLGSKSGKGVGSDGKPPHNPSPLPASTSVYCSAYLGPPAVEQTAPSPTKAIDERLKAFASHPSGLSEHPHHFKQLIS